MSVETRLRQGFRALTAWSRPVDAALAASALTPAQMTLFRRLRRGEQLHALNVLRAVRAAGEQSPDLAVAALLHDVGKTIGPFYFHERVLVVLVKKLLPARFERWSAGEPRGWTRPFAISRRHPEWSARMLAEAGASACAVDLCRRHADPIDPPRDETERLLHVLQAADNAN